MGKRVQHLGLVFSLGLACMSTLASDDKGTLNLSFENDLFTTGEDNHYTHGSELSYVSDTYQPEWLVTALSWLPLYEPGADTRFVWTLGQKIFTPNDLSREELIVDDRPYAGWLFTSLGLLTDSRDGLRHVDKVELVVGVVGPDSGAASMQREVHEIVDAPIPQGWDNQLDDEVTFDLVYQRDWMIPLNDDKVDLVPKIGLQLGTALRYFNTGATLRVGSGVNSDYGPPLIRPSAAGSGYFQQDQAFYWYLFIGLHGRYVEHNIFLDGNRDGDSHSVDKRRWVADAQVGAVMGFDNWRLALTNIFRSEEFEEQDEPDEFGSVSISYRF